MEQCELSSETRAHYGMRALYWVLHFCIMNSEIL